MMQTQSIAFNSCPDCLQVLQSVSYYIQYSEFIIINYLFGTYIKFFISGYKKYTLTSKSFIKQYQI
ncbi:hypothetical protein pb186bvf_015963 [Paramecium bursaria]